jgi:nitrogen regulatory protein P-II 1
MKHIDLIIPHERFDLANKILYKHKAGGCMFHDIKGRGKAKPEPVRERVEGHGGHATGRTYTPEFGTRTRLEVIVPDSVAEQLIQDLLTTLSTGSAKDGKIFVSDLDQAYDIGTKQTGDVAV